GDARRTETAMVAAIDGLPGVGKTALSVHWAREVADAFPGGILHADLHAHSHGSAPKPASRVLEQFLVALGVPERDIPAPVNQRADLFRSVTTGRAVLIILDDAADSTHASPLLLGSAGSAALVTSRRRLTGLAVRAGAHRLSLSPLADNASQSMLRGIIGDHRVDAEPEAAAVLARRCGHLPLALRLAAERLAASPHRTVAAAARELSEGSVLDTLTDGTERVLPRTFWHTYRDLPHDAARTFRLLSLHPAGDITLRAAAALTQLPAATARRQVEELIAVHLIEEIGRDRYRFHGLVHEYATERARIEDPEPLRAAAIEALTTADADAPQTPARLLVP
ncbi:NB-ARC domain-containing protein, partial [Streptomyces formicae]